MDTNKKEQTTTDDTDFTDLGSARGSHAGFGGLAETISSPCSTRRYLESGKQESRKGISERESKGPRGERVKAVAERVSMQEKPAPFLSSFFPDSKILLLLDRINERSVLVRTDFTDPSQDASATNNQIISWTYHSPFSGFSYFP
jgi:hypothetical protein